MENKIKNRIHTLCCQDDMRPNMNHVYFHNSCAVATDGNVIACIDLKTQLDKEIIDHLEGKYLHRVTFELVFNQMIAGINILNRQTNTITICHCRYGRIDVPLVSFDTIGK